MEEKKEKMDVKNTDSTLEVPTAVNENEMTSTLNVENTFEGYSAQEKEEILALSKAIDLSKIENIMEYRI